MVQCFKELNVWQEARKFTIKIAQIVKKPLFCKDFNLADQITRSTRSIMSNIAEGFGRYTHKDFKHFLTMARGSLTETQNHLYVALDLQYITKEEFQELFNQTIHISKLINGLIAHLKQTINDPDYVK